MAKMIPFPGAFQGDDERTVMLPAARLALLATAGPLAGHRFAFEGEALTLGRSTDNSVTIPSAGVSRKHARIEYANGGYWLMPENTVNGSRVNGELVTEPRQLADRDQVAIGDSTFVVDCPDPNKDAELDQVLGEIAPPPAPTQTPMPMPSYPQLAEMAQRPTMPQMSRESRASLPVMHAMSARMSAPQIAAPPPRRRTKLWVGGFVGLVVIAVVIAAVTAPATEPAEETRGSGSVEPLATTMPSPDKATDQAARATPGKRAVDPKPDTSHRDVDHAGAEVASAVDDKPTGDKPTGDKPTGDKPTGDKPTGDKPTGDKPASTDTADADSSKASSDTTAGTDTAADAATGVLAIDTTPIRAGERGSIVDVLRVHARVKRGGAIAHYRVMTAAVTRAWTRLRVMQRKYGHSEEYADFIEQARVSYRRALARRPKHAVTAPAAGTIAKVKTRRGRDVTAASVVAELAVARLTVPAAIVEGKGTKCTVQLASGKVTGRLLPVGANERTLELDRIPTGASPGKLGKVRVHCAGD